MSKEVSPVQIDAQLALLTYAQRTKGISQPYDFLDPSDVSAGYYNGVSQPVTHSGEKLIVANYVSARFARFRSLAGMAVFNVVSSAVIDEPLSAAAPIHVATTAIWGKGRMARRTEGEHMPLIDDDKPLSLEILKYLQTIGAYLSPRQQGHREVQWTSATEAQAAELWEDVKEPNIPVVTLIRTGLDFIVA